MMMVAGISQTRNTGYRAKLSQPSGASGPVDTTVPSHSRSCDPAVAAASQPSQAGKAQYRSDTTATAAIMTANGSAAMVKTAFAVPISATGAPARGFAVRPIWNACATMLMPTPDARARLAPRRGQTDAGTERGPCDRPVAAASRQAEDLAGIGIAAVIWASAASAGQESIRKLRPGTTGTSARAPPGQSSALGNLAVARYKLVVGRRINSATLVADARHSWLDALSSAGALAGLIAVASGQPWGDR